MKKVLAILCAIALFSCLTLAVSAAEVTVETVVDMPLPTGTGWQQTSAYTTLWGGTVDSGFMVEGGCLKVYLTANAADLWQVRLALNGAQWTEMDWHVDPTSVANPIGTIVDNGDGTFVVSFAYEDIVSVYGTDDFAGTLGEIYICTNAGSDVTVTKVAYEYTEEVADTPAPTGDTISVFVALMAVSAMGAAVVLKKKDF